MMPTPELSIIIPTLNEARSLPLLLGDLVRQQGVVFEVIVSDGCSSDATCQLANELFDSGQLLGACHVGPSGRGRQLNAGASLASSAWLLFLHADSRLGNTHQLQEALEFMRVHQQREASDLSAGRFALRFDPPDEEGFGLFFYETKARLGRPGCIHGDQGLLLTKAFFQRVGPYREDLPVMEDTCLAEAIRAHGQWLLLPGELVTSARRFQAEGLKSRQTLNALMMNSLTIGWLEFFTRAPDIYRQQDRNQPLQLQPFFSLFKDLFAEMTPRRRWTIWLATGTYVRSQAWQIGLALDCRQAFRNGVDRQPLAGCWLKWFDRWFDPATNHRAGHVLTALLVRLWFAWQLCRKDAMRNR
ncbi:MAG: TIGR04283 family arsenosugar biosynthesis glycosyltransferase [Desulfuromonadales bacterium]|jgi:rSAM/selenodomain-associated transferase 2|nr:TIGR04283 family arsenosugar biosynthesis glycosyltransferase [Desulfuromonadales bacterium]